MENVSHSRQPNILSKKSCNGNSTNGFAPAKSMYDDVFGGPPKFGAPTLSPRVEDYSEIFGGFHVSRASSIPVLDLPLVDEAEVFFDVRNSGFDYGEVFGGFNGPDFAVSYEELVMMDQSNGHDDSSDEAWTPADPECLSEESDHSAKNQCLSNGDSHESIDGSMEFNISYHKASQSSNEDMSNGITHVTKLLAVPGYTLVVDKTTSFPKTDDKYPPLQGNDDGHLNIDFGGEMVGGRHLRKTMSHPANGNTGGSLFGNDVRSQQGYVRNGSLPNQTFVTISDVSLRTQPSQLPPPSRPPPALDVKKRDSNDSTSNCRSVGSEDSAGASSPPYFDVEVDASSSAAASAAAIKEAMEKAQAKLKSAKELMERKRDGFHHTKSGSKNDRKDKEGKVTEPVDGSGSTKDERVQGTCEREENRVEFSVLEERQKVATMTQLIPDSLEGEKHLNAGKKLAEDKHGRELSSQGSDKIDGASEWKQATEFFELVKTNKSRKVFDLANNENILAPNANIHDRGKSEQKAAMDSLEQPQENDKKAKAVRADHELEEYEKRSKVTRGACEQVKNNGKSEAVNVAYEQTGLEKKVQSAQEVFRLEENEKKQTRAYDLQKYENIMEIQPKESNFEVKQTIKHKEKKARPKVANRSMEIEKIFTDDREDLEKRQRSALEQEENDKKFKAALEQAENERRLKEAFEQEQKEKRVKEARETEENEKKLKEAYRKEENEKRLREAREREENERRLKEAHEKEENDQRLKETLEKEEAERRQREVIEQEENERRQRETCERELNEKILKEVFEKEENERRLKEAVKQEENEKRQREACESEENGKKLKEALEQEENEKKQKKVHEREETEKGHKEAFEKEEIEKRIKEAHEGEEIGKRLDEASRQEENGKLRAAQQGEKSEAGLNRAREPEEIGDTLQDSFKWKENEMKLKAAGESNELMGLNKVGEAYILLNQACRMDDAKNFGATQLVSEHEVKSETLEATEEIAYAKIEKIPTELRNSEKDAAVETVVVDIDGKTNVSGTVQANLQHEKNRFLMEDTTELPCADESVKEKAAYGIGQQNIEKIMTASRMGSDIGNQGTKRGKNIQQAQVAVNQEDCRDNFISSSMVKESVETGQKMEAVQPATLEVKGSIQRTALQVNASQSTERKVKNPNEILSSEEKETEKMKTEKELEKERLRKIEEEREREREREKDRMAVDRSALEACERAERAAVERATAEARQRALTEARERLEKACAEAREKSLSDKTFTEARLRAERAAVERATAEARERAFEKAMAERAAFEARERIERSVSDKFSASSRNNGVRSSLSSSDLQDLQYQSVGSVNGSRYPYSLGYDGSYHAERSEGVEGESAQRCKARLERHRRTAERAAKALAEKNMRDLLAQREQAERNRLAETLDADVKRWSSGKEGNLRALLSTLQYILGPDSGWQPIPLTEVITAAAVKKAYRKATLCVHPDKLQQRGASIQQKYICEKVFDLLKEAWNKFNSEER